MRDSMLYQVREIDDRNVTAERVGFVNNDDVAITSINLTRVECVVLIKQYLNDD